jgi:hypothetical protein
MDMKNKYEAAQKKADKQKQGVKKRQSDRNLVKQVARDLASKDWATDSFKTRRIGKVSKDVVDILKEELLKKFGEEPEKLSDLLPHVPKVAKMREWLQEVAPDYAVLPGANKTP